MAGVVSRDLGGADAVSTQQLALVDLAVRTKLLAAVLAAEPDAVPPAVHTTRRTVATEIQELTRRIHAVERQLGALSAALPGVAQLRTVPRIGPLSATAVVAFVGDAHRFPSARHFASAPLSDA